jgi:hypothetical protein
LTLVSGFTSDDKVYDGNTDAVVSSWGTLVGVVGGDDVALDVSGGSASFAEANVGTWLVTAAGLALSGTAAGNYTLSQPSDTSAITAKGLTLDGFASDDKVYDGNTDAVVSSWGTLVGVVGGDDVALDVSGGSASFAEANVGTWLVTAAGLALSGTAAGNYTLSQPSDTSAITAKGLTLDGFASDDKVYDGNTDAVVSSWGTLVGVVGGDDVALDVSGGSASFAEANVGTWLVTAAGLALSGTAAGNYTLSQPNDTSAITAKGLTLDGFASDDKVYDGNTDAVVSSWGTLLGVVGGDDVALDVSGGSASFAEANVGTWLVTAAGLALSGTAAGNYTLSQPSDTSAITAKGLTLDGFASDDKVYDGNTDAVVSSWGTLVGVVGGDDVALDVSGGSASFAEANVGTWLVTAAGLALSGTAAGNYTLAQPSDMSDITAKGLTVSGFASDDKVYDGNTDATVSAWGDLVGVIGGDTVTLVTSGASASFADKNVGTDKPVMATGLTLGGADAANYSLTQPGDTSDITAKGLTVSGFASDDKVYDGNTDATVSAWGDLVGVIGGDTVTLVTSGASASFADKNVGSDKPVTATGLTLGGADAANYSLTQPGDTSDITAKALTVSGFASDDKVYDGNTDATVSAWGDLVGVIGGDAVMLLTASASASFADKNVGTDKPVTATGLTLGGADAANYSLTQPGDTSDITAKALTVSGFASDDKVYDANTDAVVSEWGDLVGVIGGDAVTLVTAGASASFADKNVGSDKPVTATGLTLGGADAANYSLTQPGDTSDITAKGLTVSGFASDDKVYDGNTDAAVSDVGRSGRCDRRGHGDVGDGGASASFADKNVGTTSRSRPRA